MTIDPRAASHPFGVWDERAQRWRVPAGRYTLRVGTSSRDARLSETIEVAGAPSR
jgi:beta-glucosidase